MRLVDWLFEHLIRGFDKDDEEEEEEQEENEEENEEESEDEEEEHEEEDDKDDKFKSEHSKRAVLSDLAKERRERKKLAKALAKREKEDKKRADSEKTEIQRAKDEAEAEKAKAKKLATGFATLALNQAISKEAQKLKFKDVEDALSLVSRDDIEYEQDEDDPSEIEIDETSVAEAVKKIAEKKPHLIDSDEEGGDRTGSKFGGKKKGAKTTPDDELRKKYPALRR